MSGQISQSCIYDNIDVPDHLKFQCVSLIGAFQICDRPGDPPELTLYPELLMKDTFAWIHLSPLSSDVEQTRVIYRPYPLCNHYKCTG